MPSASELKQRLLVGWVILLALALGTVSLLWLRSSGWLQSGTSVYVISLERANGLKAGDPVEIRGWQVGTVAGFHPTANAIEVRISVADTLALPEGTRARLVQAELFGAKRIDLVLGTSSLNLAPGGRIAGETAPDLAVAIEKMGGLASAVQPEAVGALLSELNRTARGLNELLDPRTVAQMKSSIDRLEKLLAQAQRIAGEAEEKKLVAQIDQSLKQVQGALMKSESLLDSAKAALNEGRRLVPPAERALQRAETMLTNANRQLSKLDDPRTLGGRALSDTAFGGKIDTTLAKLNQTMDFVRNSAINVRVRFFKGKQESKANK